MLRGFATIKGEHTEINNLDFELNNNKNDSACIFLEKPSEDEIAKVCTKFKFQQKNFLKYNKEARSLRYSMKPLVFVFIDYYVEKNLIKRTHMLFAMKKNILIVMTPQSSKFYTELFDNIVLRIKKKKKKKNLPAQFLYYFMYEDARGNYDVLDEMDNRVMAIEESIKKPEIKQKTINQIVKLKRNCFLMSKCLWASAKMVYTIRHGLTPLVLDKDLNVLMDDVYDTLIHQTDLLTVQREILTDLLEICATVINNNLARISNQLNVIMKKMAALTIIIMVPTLITSFYGMNFRNMPELNVPHASITVWCVVFVSMVISYYIFHKKEWI